MVLKRIMISLSQLIIVISSCFIFSGCTNDSYVRYMERVEEIATTELRLRHFRNFIVEETIFNEETGGFEVSARSIDGEMEGLVYIYFVDGQTIIRRVSGEAGTILPPVTNQKEP